MKLLSLFFLTFALHPLHVSVTEVKFDEKDKELEITSRLFLDDLESAIREQLKQPTLDILQPTTGTAEEVIGNYLLQNLQIKVDGKLTKLKYLGHEVDGDAVIAYLYAPGIKKMNSITVMHSSITELFDDQSNLVHVTKNNTTRSLRLHRQSLTESLTF